MQIDPRNKMMTDALYIPGMFTAAVLLAEVVTAIYIFGSMHQAFSQGSTIGLLLLPLVVIALCTFLFLSAIKDRSRQVADSHVRYELSAAWPWGALLGLVGLVLAALGGPHVVGVFVYFLVGQVLVFLFAHFSRLRKR